MRWTVESSIGGSGLPVEEWGTAARARLTADARVEHVHIATSRGEDEVDGVEVGSIEISVTLEAVDADAASARVGQAVSAALHDAIGDRPAGWTASSHTRPAEPR